MRQTISCYPQVYSIQDRTGKMIAPENELLITLRYILPKSAQLKINAIEN